MHTCGWYRRIVQYLKTMQCPEGMIDNEITLKLQAIKYVIIDN